MEEKKYYTPEEYRRKTNDVFDEEKVLQKLKKQNKEFLSRIFGGDIDEPAIVFLYSTKKSKNIADIRKVPDAWNRWIEADYLITFYVSNKEWEDFSKLSVEGKEAVLFHELCHIRIVKKTTHQGRQIRRCSLVHHDMEEFLKVVQNYGAWDQRYNEMAAAIIKKAPVTTKSIKVIGARNEKAATA